MQLYKDTGRNMNALKKSKKNCPLLFLLLMGCTSSSYQVLNSGEYGTELRVTPDRVLLECERLLDADERNLSGFMMHVLDEQNTVVTLVQGHTLDNKTCDLRIKKIDKILKNRKNIYIAGTGALNQPRTVGKTYTFPKKGIFPNNGRVLGFAAIANEDGACYDAYSADEKPCPRDPFPLSKKPNHK